MSNQNRIRILSRCSFRQLLLVAFLLIAGLLVATSVRALFTLEGVAAHNRQASRQAVDMTEHLQRLQERTAAMERAARQFLVLDDPIFRQRYQEAAAQARASLDAVAADMPGVATDVVSAWKDNNAALLQVLQQPAAQRGSAAADVQRALARLPALNQQLSDQSDAAISSHNDILLAELDQQRAMLSWQVIGAIVLSVLLACVFGLWLSMPLAQLETGIDRLGSGRFDTPIAIHGPADLRRLGQQLDWLRQRLAKVQAEKIRFIENVARRLRVPDTGVSPDAALQRQIADVLNYHEAVLQAQQVHRLPVDLRVLLNKIVDDHRELCQAREIRVEVSGSVRTLGLDLTKMEYVLNSLLSNAVRFSPPAGVVQFVLTQIDRRGLQLDCIDQGPGVAPDDAPYIFDPFHATRPAADDASGTPVSLAIAREYIEAQHGIIALLPSATGAHFRITLPDEY
jgi:two-component system sensor histidine kinase GlrK